MHYCVCTLTRSLGAFRHREHRSSRECGATRRSRDRMSTTTDMTCKPSALRAREVPSTAPRGRLPERRIYSELPWNMAASPPSVSHRNRDIRPPMPLSSPDQCRAIAAQCERNSPDLPALPTPRTTLAARYVVVLVWCKSWRPSGPGGPAEDDRRGHTGCMAIRSSVSGKHL